MEVDAWIKQNCLEYPNKFKSIDKITLGSQKVEELAKHLGQDEGKQDYVQVIQQFVSDEVNIPLTWVHAVQNLQPCVKFAWDYLKLKNLCVIVQGNHLGRHVMHNATD
jgi:hypothetical protein